jgi:predicted deacylase
VIYGDDLTGCTTPLDSISAVVLTALRTEAKLTDALLDLHERSNNALEMLARPPAEAQVENPVQLQALLSDRLDKILSITQKVASLTSAAKSTGTPAVE